jgi:hypothetical protein
MPKNPKKKMNIAATTPPSRNEPSMVVGFARNALSVSTGSKNG